MLQSHSSTRRASTSSRAPAATSFDRWLERTQRKWHGKGAGSGDFASRTGSHYHRHTDPQTESWGGPAQHAPRNTLHDGAALTRLEELEGLLFTQAHFNRSNAVPDPYTYTNASLTSTMMDGRHLTSPQPQPLPSPSQRPLFLALGDGDFSSRYGAGGPSVLNEPFACGREPLDPTGGGSGEAERYIARLEDEVQALLIECGDSERVTVAAVAARDGLGLQLQEMQWRLELEREEHAAAQSLTHDFLRRQSFFRLLEERSRVMELNTQISLLKHEVKLAEAMRVQAQTSAATAAASSSAAAMLQRQLEEQHLAQSVTVAVRDLLQQEYTRLSEAMSQMPHRMQSPIEERHTITAGEAAAAAKEEGKNVTTTFPPQQTEPNVAEAAEQRRLCALLESALAAVTAQKEASTDTTVQSRQLSLVVQQQQPPPVEGAELTPSDSAHLLSLVKRAHDYQATVLEVYCNAVDAKSSLAQYEMNIVRLIHEKQASLTWAALYEEKKDEVRHLSEKLMEMRGELRAATSTASTNVASARGRNGVASFAGSTTSQSYEAYAAPYVPPKKAGAQQQQQLTASYGGSPRVGPLTTVQVRAKVLKKSIEELREEARRLGAHPAVHYPPPVTSPSPSLPSLYVGRMPNAAETTLLQMPSAVLEAARPGTPEQHHAVAAASAVRSPVVAQIRSFPAREGSRSSSTASSPVPPPPQPVKAAKATTLNAATEGSMREEITTPGKKPATKRTGGSMSVSARPASLVPPSPSSLKASSGLCADATATPVPASRVPQLHIPALHRVMTTASSSSLSSARSKSEKKPSTGHAASPPTPTNSPPAQAKSAIRGTAAAAAAHNSFDDDNDDSEEEVNAKAAAKQPVTRAGTAATLKVSRSHTSSLAASGTSAAAAALRDTVETPALQVKRISLDETVRALEKAKRGGAGNSDDDSDADTSSLSLSITSSSRSQVSVAKARKGSTKPTEKRRGRATAAAAAVSPPLSAKAKHPRRSSFDDDEDSGSELPTKTPPLSALKVRSGVANMTSTNPSAAATATKSQPTVPALASVVPTVKTDAVGVSPVPVLAAPKPQKLKLPTW